MYGDLINTPLTDHKRGICPEHFEEQPISIIEGDQVTTRH
jgi:hypothetical protein